MLIFLSDFPRDLKFWLRETDAEPEMNLCIKFRFMKGDRFDERKESEYPSHSRSRLMIVADLR
jgi:hypothetical protein